MFKKLLALSLLCLVCWVIQLLPVISVPLTSPDYNIYLSNYGTYKFGVFGICDVNRQLCSDPRIGYPSTNSTFYSFNDEESYGYGGVVLPSNVRYTISKLLVVHVVAFCFSCLLLVVIFVLFVVMLVDDINLRQKRIELGHVDNMESTNENEGQSDEEDGDEAGNGKRKIDLTPYLNLMLVLTLFSVLTTLLALLCDILLFTPNLSYLGWLQLIPIVSMALIASLLCFIKRSISSRKFFESEYQYVNDDMRMMRKQYVDEFWNDTASDDGFYVYTDGFYTRNGDQVDETTNASDLVISTPDNDPTQIRTPGARRPRVQESIQLTDLRPS
ncbi:RIM9 pH-response regulator protein palI/RIM9 [Candida maltosa Xu316]